MAACQDCGQEMTQGVACTDPLVEVPGHGSRPRVPYGQEETPAMLALPTMAFYVRAEEQRTGRPYQPHDWTRDARGQQKDCNDCACPPGGLHHPGCDVERCPFCGWQLISCGCWG